MKQLIFFLFTLICSTVTAQDASIQKIRLETQRTIKKPLDTSNKIWKKGGLYGINISQGSLSNWAAGGDNFSLSVNSILNLFAFYKKGKTSWDNTFDFNLGYVNTTSIGGRKNDDRFDRTGCQYKFCFLIVALQVGGKGWILHAFLKFRIFA